MIKQIVLIIGCTAVMSSGAQGTGLFFDAHLSQGKMKGDQLFHLENRNIGVQVGDSILYLDEGKEHRRKNNYTIASRYPVDFQYAVRYSFLVGYEKSFTKVLSLRGAIGYQNVLLDANAASIPGFQEGDMTEVPFVSAEITRHWLSIPVDLKAMIPIRRSGIYFAAGPKMSILLSSEYTDSLTNISRDLTDKTPRVNVGIGFRIGFELAIARAGYLLIEGGYHKGLVNTLFLSDGKMMEGEIVPLGIGFRLNVPVRKDVK